MRKYIALLAVVLLSACTKDDSDIREILAADGYTKIQTTGYEPFKCDEKDTFSNGFIAEKNGMYVEGVVCSGLVKGNTIRVSSTKMLPKPVVKIDPVEHAADSILAYRAAEVRRKLIDSLRASK